MVDVQCKRIRTHKNEGDRPLGTMSVSRTTSYIANVPFHESSGNSLFRSGGKVVGDPALMYWVVAVEPGPSVFVILSSTCVEEGDGMTCADQVWGES